MLQLTYDVGDIIGYVSPFVRYNLLIEHVEDTYMFNTLEQYDVKGIILETGTKFRWVLPKYLGRSKDTVLNKVA